MSFEATFTVEDKTFKVLSFHYQTSRDHDRTGRPTSALTGIKMELLLEHSPDCILLHQWAYTNYDVKNGKITFMRRDNFQKQTEVRFEDGYIVDISVSFTNSEQQPMTERIVICANKFEYESQGNLVINAMEWPT